jgi:amidohydrolase
MSEFLQQAKSLKKWSVKHRRHLHQHPEVGLQEKQTSQYCRNIFKSLGYKVKHSYGYGFIADLDIKNAKKKIAFRADMDALQILEKNTCNFASKNKGVAHMCGHDAHMAIAFTAAKMFAQNVKKLSCSIRFIFQPNEERLPGGAKGMIAKGCLNGVDEIYGLHVYHGLKTGEVASRTGTLFAAVNDFKITIKGKSVHAAASYLGLDPLYCGAKLVVDLQSIISRHIDSAHQAVLSVTQFHSGSAYNIIADTAELAGTVRTFYKSDRSLVEKLMRQHLEALKVLGYEYKLSYERGYDSLVNKKYGIKRIVAAASNIVGKRNVDSDLAPIAGGEDFCYYLQKKPGAFFVIGCADPKWKNAAPLHSSVFKIDENAMPVGAAIFAELAQ